MHCRVEYYFSIDDNEFNEESDFLWGSSSTEDESNEEINNYESILY